MKGQANEGEGVSEFFGPQMTVQPAKETTKGEEKRAGARIFEEGGRL